MLQPLKELKDYENGLRGRDPTVTPVSRASSGEGRDDDSDYAPPPEKPKKPKKRRYVNDPGELTPLSAKIQRRSERNSSRVAPDVPLQHGPPTAAVANVTMPAPVQAVQEPEDNEPQVGSLGFFGTLLHLVNAQRDDDDGPLPDGVSSD